MRADGKIRFNERGAYDGAQTYFPNDQVSSTTGVFRAQTNVAAGNSPETNTPASETAGTGVVSTTPFPYVDFAQRFTPTVEMKISGFRYYAQAAGDHLAGKVGIAQNITNATVEPTWVTDAVVSILANSRTVGWNTVTFPAEITLAAGTTYVVAWYGTGKNVGYASSSATGGPFLTLGSTFYNSSSTASGPSYQNENNSIRAYFDWTFVGTVPWVKIGDLPPASPFKENAAKDAVIPVDNADSWIVGSDRLDHDPASTAKDFRAFYNKAKGAFRAGRSNGTSWDTASTGDNSFASGFGNTASGAESHAEGIFTKALGQGSHAEGQQTEAHGQFTHAEGAQSRATGTLGSHAEGSQTLASGNYGAHAEGRSTTASNDASHAEGQSTNASGQWSHAEGNGSWASSDAAHAEGYYSVASGIASHAQGHGTYASRVGEDAFGSGRFTAPYNVATAQGGSMVLRTITTTATPRDLAAGIVGDDPSPLLTGQTTSVLTVSTSRAFQLKISTVARQPDVAGATPIEGAMAGWTWEGLVGRNAAGNARIIGTPIQAAWGDTPATDAWSVAVSINTTDATNNYVAVTVTGQVDRTIRWVAKMEWVEVAG